MPERWTITMKGKTRHIDVPDGFTAKTIQGNASSTNYQESIPNPVPRPAPGEEGDWEPTIPNPVSKRNHLVQGVWDFLTGKSEQEVRNQNQTNARAASDATIAADKAAIVVVPEEA